MVEDLHTFHHEIRSRAKEEGCEYELDDIKFLLLNYLNFLRKTP
jgi:fatty-acid desaturase